MPDYSDPLGLIYGGMDFTSPEQRSQGLLQLTPQEIERMAMAQSPAFGVYPQLQPYRSRQDITASANVPVDVLRGRIAGTLGLFGDVVNQPIPMVRPLQMISQAITGQQTYPNTEYFLENLPLRSETPIGDVAGRLGSFAPINPMPAVRGVQKLGSLLGGEIATRVATGKPLLPSLLEEPQTAMFAAPPAEQVGGGLLQAEVSPLGFYSAVEQQALKIPRKQGTGESFLNDLLKGQDVKKYEIEAMGLDTYLKGKQNVTRQEVQDFITNNKIDVQEVQLGGQKSIEQKENLQKALDDLRTQENYLDSLLPSNISQLDRANLPFWAEAASRGDAYEMAKIDRLNLPTEVKQEVLNLGEKQNIYSNLFNDQTIRPSKFEQYTLAGGENYRELLLKLPPQQSVIEQWIVYRPNGASIGGYSSEEYAKKAAQEIGGTYKKGESLVGETGYRSGHWSDQNVLAHLRVNDRIDADGKKMLLVEEVQSDWHQAGREKGYNTPQRKAAQQEKLNSILTERQNLLEEQKRLEDLALPYTSQGKDAPSEIVSRWSTVSNRLQNLQREQNNLGKTFDAGIPDAPFKETWYQLALKRAIKEAVDKGYDRIGLTTGTQQAKRYDLSKQVEQLNYKKNADGTYKVSAQAGGRGNMIGESIPEDKLSDYVGKEISQKIIENQGKDVNFGGIGSASQPKDIWKGLSGIDLKIGGEGMKKYYDEIYPNFLDKYGKKYGARIGETQLQGTASKDELAARVYGKGETYKNLPSESKRKIDQMYLNSGEKVRYLDITPEMKKAVQGGQPLASVEGMTGLLA